MFDKLRKAAIAVVAASIFIVTTIIGAIAGFAGAFVRSQFPEQESSGAATQNNKETKQPASPAHGSRISQHPSKGTR